MSSAFPWSLEVAARLKASIEAVGGQAQVARLSGVSRQQLNNIANGKSVPDPATIDRILPHIDLTTAKLFQAKGVAAQPVSRPKRGVPVLDIEAAAGAGRQAAEQLLSGKTGDDRPFDEEWLRLSFGNPANLRMITVRGDSQAPLMEDGDEIIIDVSKQDRADGMAVVLLGDQLMVKRLQFAGPVVQLSSANPVYPPITIDLRDEGNDFKIIARVVWRSGRMR